MMAALFHADDSQTVIDTYVHYLRKKISKSVIRTVHGMGYQIGDAS
ncbi:winged helix-turn-helix domain-containing protein [Arthrobacter sp. GMC3]|nr:winged helix-turn-helix domain-containing protein [Arthrobacter sp. GMC3]